MEPTIPEPPASDVTTDVVDVSELRAGFTADHAARALDSERDLARELHDLGATDEVPSLAEPEPDDPTERGPIPAAVAPSAVAPAVAREASDAIAHRRPPSVPPITLDVPSSPRGRAATTTLGTLALPQQGSSSLAGWLLLSASLLVFSAGVVALFTFGPAASAPAAPHARAAPRVAEVLSAHGIASAR